MATTLFLTLHLSILLDREVSGTTISKLSSSIFGELVKSPSLVQKGITQSCSRNKSEEKVKAKSKRETVVPDPDYRIPIVLLGATGALVYTDNLLAAVPVGLLRLLLLVQDTRVRFVFDDEALISVLHICESGVLVAKFPYLSVFQRNTNQARRTNSLLPHNICECHFTFQIF
ncbi:Chaperone protein HscA-like protein [Bienertia sinuspersici]